MITAASCAETGSSPLSRGILHDHCRQLCGDRIIPALAGNTWEASIGTLWSPDHPRSRGEYLHLTGDTLESLGSSPLSRGIPAFLMAAVSSVGIIPALAGNT